MDRRTLRRRRKNAAVEKMEILELATTQVTSAAV